MEKFSPPCEKFPSVFSFAIIITVTDNWQHRYFHSPITVHRSPLPSHRLAPCPPFGRTRRGELHAPCSVLPAVFIVVPLSRCPWSCSLVASRATYAEAVSDRELALPGHAQLRRRFENPRASCARRHRARFPQRQNLSQRRRLPLLSYNYLWPAHSTASQFRRSKSAVLRAQTARAARTRHLA